MAGRHERQGIYVYIRLIHVAQQKLMQPCKVIILRLKKNKEKVSSQLKKILMLDLEKSGLSFGGR